MRVAIAHPGPVLEEATQPVRSGGSHWTEFSLNKNVFNVFVFSIGGDDAIVFEKAC